MDINLYQSEIKEEKRRYQVKNKPARTWSKDDQEGKNARCGVFWKQKSKLKKNRMRTPTALRCCFTKRIAFKNYFEVVANSTAIARNTFFLIRGDMMTNGAKFFGVGTAPLWLPGKPDLLLLFLVNSIRNWRSN